MNTAVFDHFAHTVVDKPQGQRPEQFRVDEDAFGLVEAAGLVFTAGQVDADLAADAAVYLGDNRRRNLDKGHAPQECSRGKAAQVADDAAAEGDDIVAARNACIG